LPFRPERVVENNVTDSYFLTGFILILKDRTEFLLTSVLEVKDTGPETFEFAKLNKNETFYLFEKAKVAYKKNHFRKFISSLLLKSENPFTNFVVMCS